MAVGGVAVRITAESWSSGSVRLKRSTAEQLLGPEILQDSRGQSGDGPKCLLLYPCPAQRSSTPLNVQLRIVPTMARQGQSLGASPPAPPSLHCELCGLGAWLRGQGAVPGVHWVQLWRGAGGALRLRLCDGEPTELPGEEATEQQMETGGTEPNADAEGTAAVGAAVVPAQHTSRMQVASDAAAAQAASAEAAAADAVAKLLGMAAQAVADAAAPWKLHAPTRTAPCMPAGAAWQGPATSCQLGAAGAGADGVTRAPRGAPMTPAPLLLPMPDPQLPPPMLSPPRAPPELPAQQAAHPAARAGAPPFVGAPGAPELDTAARLQSSAAASAAAGTSNEVFTLRISAVGGRHLGWLNAEALTLWPEACQLHSGQAMAVTLHLLQDQAATSTRHTAAREDVSAKLARYNATTVAIFGLGRADDVFCLWRDHAGAVWASQQHSGTRQGLQQEQGQGQERIVGGAAVTRGISTMGILTGRVGNWRIILRTRNQGQHLQSMPEWVTVHVGVADANRSTHEGAHEEQQQGSEFTVRLLCSLATGRRLQWYLSSASALIKALGARDGDTVQLQYESDGRLAVRRAAGQPQRQQQAAGTVPLAACPADSILVGYNLGSRMDPRVGAVHALWPEVASQLACGHSTEMEVHPAVAGAGVAALGPFRLTLMLRTWKGRSPVWRLTGCGPLFGALGAQDGDAIHMWRSPEGGRLVAGVQPRGGVPRGMGKVRLGQQQGKEQEQQEQEQGGRRRQQLHRRARQNALHRSDSGNSVHAASDGEDGGAKEMYSHGDCGVEKCGRGENGEGQEEGPPGPPGDGLSRPSKRARAAHGAAQQYGGISAAHQRHIQPTACPAGSTLVGFKCRTLLDVRATAVQALWSDLASQMACGESIGVEVHPAVADVGMDADVHVGEALGPFRVTLTRYSWRTRSVAWRLSGCGPLFRVLGAHDSDAILMWRSPGDGRLMAGVQPRGEVHRGREEQQQGQEVEQQQEEGKHALPTVCPAGSIFVGRKIKGKLRPRAGAVRALWPKVASQLACGRSTEVEVHPAVEGASGEVLEPFRAVLTMNRLPGKSPTWQLTGCVPLFRVLGAQHGDAIFMWRSPGDGRLVAGVQPRGGARGGAKPRGGVLGKGNGVQVGRQWGAGLDPAGGEVRQVYGEHETTDEEEMWQGEDEDEDEEGEDGEAENDKWEERNEALGYGEEASTGAMLEGEGRVGPGCSVLGGIGGRGWECAGLGSGDDNEAGVGEEGEGEEEEEEPGVNWWAREVGGEFGFGEEGGEGEQDEEQV